MHHAHALPMCTALGMLFLAGMCAADGFTLAREGRPGATIVVGRRATPAARLAALELQLHVKRITGAVLPIATDAATTTGPVVLVGDSLAAREVFHADGDRLAPQEYLIRVTPSAVLLLGRDWVDTPGARAEDGMTTNWVRLRDSRTRINYGKVSDSADLPSPWNRADLELPGQLDDQGTCYATYDFLERYCGARWFGPSDLNIDLPHAETLVVPVGEVRRRPAFSHREGIAYATSVWPINQGLWDNPGAEQLALYARRMREGGDRWAGNHSFIPFRARFLPEDQAAARGARHPELFEAAHPEYFAQGGGGGEGQFCYTNPAFIRQVAQDARDFFDGKGIKPPIPALGDYFAVVPLDNAHWCQCENCQALLRESSGQRSPHFSNGSASKYLFTFVNAVAREVAKTHPGKCISTLAYWDYAYVPEGIKLEPNVAVAPCLHLRNDWCPSMRRNDIENVYKPWGAMAKERPIYLWFYWCFPEENALSGGFHCFPGFNIHNADECIKMFHRDGVRGIFFCGYGEQFDYYLGMKLLDDPTRNVDSLIGDFFTRYYGHAAGAMKRLYLRIEEIYSKIDCYPEVYRTGEHHVHQNEEIAWRYLGNEQRMAELGAMLEVAKRSAVTDTEKARVALFDRGVWQYMLEGRKAYLAKNPGTAY